MNLTDYKEIKNQLSKIKTTVDNATSGNPYRDSKGMFANGPSKAYGKYGTLDGVHPSDAGFTPTGGEIDATGKQKFSVESSMDDKLTKATIITASATKKAANDNMPFSEISDSASYNLNKNAKELNFYASQMADGIGRASSEAAKQEPSKESIRSSLEKSQQAQTRIQRLSAPVTLALRNKNISENVRKDSQEKFDTAMSAVNTMKHIRSTSDFSGKTSNKIDVTDLMNR